MAIKIILTGKVSFCIFLRRLVFMNLDLCKGGFLRAEFEKMDERSSLTGEIRGKELLTGIELVQTKRRRLPTRGRPRSGISVARRDCSSAWEVYSEMC